MSPRRVLHVLPDLQRGGGQTVVLELVRHAHRSRYEPHVAFLARPDTLAGAFRELGPAPIVLQHGRDGVLAAALEVARHVRRLGVEVIHVHSDRDRKVGHVAALLTGIPVVGHLHAPWPHLDPLHARDAGRVAQLWSRAKAVGRRSLERDVVRHYVAVSGEVAAFHADRLHAPTTVVPNGVDTRRVRPASEFERRLVRRALGVDGAGVVLVSVGRLAPGKGHEDVLQVLPALPDAVLLIAGDGELRDALERDAQALGVSARVRFLGEMPDVVPALQAADVFVFGSRTEGLPLAVLEAMAAGLALVAYDIPGVRAVVRPNVDGVLVPVGDFASLAARVAELADTRPRREQMGAAARRVVEEAFDARAMARSVERVYDEVLGSLDVEGRVRHGGQLVAS